MIATQGHQDQSGEHCVKSCDHQAQAGGGITR